MTNGCSVAADPVGQDLHPGSSEPTRLQDLNGHAYQGFLALGSSAAQSWLFAADVGLVHLHRAGQSVSAGAHQHERSRCSIAHAVAYEPISSERCRLNADMPSLPEANNHQASNHTVSGVRRRSNSVPAVTDVRPPQPAHLYPPSATRQPPVWSQRGHKKPSGQRSQSR